jgi:hypothetical protein
MSELLKEASKDWTWLAVMAVFALGCCVGFFAGWDLARRREQERAALLRRVSR